MELTTPTRSSRARNTVAALVAVLAFGLLPVGAAQPSVELSVPDAQALLAVAGARLTTATAALHTAAADQAALQANLAATQAVEAQQASALVTARAEVRAYAIEEFVSGGEAAALEYLFESAGATDLAHRHYLLEDRNADAVDAAQEFERLTDAASAQTRVVADQLDQAAARVESAQVEVASAALGLQVANELLFAAVVKEAQVRAALLAAVSRPPDGDDVPGGVHALGEGWALLRQCESGGDYQVVNATGKYRGAYQFDQRTWEGVGGTGDPAVAPPAEQDLRAQTLFDQRGARPWPHCGRYLGSAPG